MDTRTKIIELERFEHDSAQRLGVLRGRFDVLTADHCRVAAKTKEGVDLLVALVLRDEPVRHAMLDESSRAQLAAALGPIDRVILCDETESEALIAEWKPVVAADAEAYVRRSIVADVLERHPIAE